MRYHLIVLLSVCGCASNSDGLRSQVEALEKQSVEERAQLDRAKYDLANFDKPQNTIEVKKAINQSAVSVVKGTYLKEVGANVMANPSSHHITCEMWQQKETVAVACNNDERSFSCTAVSISGRVFTDCPGVGIMP